MRKIVNNFINQAQSKKNKVKRMIDSEGKKGMDDLKKRVKEGMPTKGEMIERFSKQASTAAQQQAAELGFQKYKLKINNLKTVADGFFKSVNSLQRTLNDIDQFLGVINSLLEKIEPLIEIFDNIIKILKKAIKALPAAYATVGLIVGLGQLLEMAASKVAGFAALVRQIPSSISHHLNKITQLGKRLLPIVIKINSVRNFINYNYNILETVYARYLENNVIGDFVSNTGLINEDSLDDSIINLENDTGGDPNNIEPPTEIEG